MVNVGSASAPWTYNRLGLLQSIPGHIEAIDYAADGQTEAITYTGLSGAGATTDFTYSPTRLWLNNLTTRNSAGTTILSGTYTRDLLGRITAINGGAAGEPANAHDWEYTYDKLGRLKEAWNLGAPYMYDQFVYQLNGNLLGRSRFNVA